ncbi:MULTISPECIES: AfsR/SARP family transcriptional regulator [unclassified Streptomyces]|uniref:AfsR/SARP family transcriptional regulator n=1 Tax=unclassified Streptomyces TaxID=2593676 RepID=UPI0022528F48|nr:MULTISPECIES: AfsR/SARP family transcriptional regulator [unclassified Streptomyces]MCX5335456.1 AfsR/SARP family transcriptional regulator [Streptomyces sp. NBC_00140]MCX5338202.1 AfsR/SARP family transcriptional regulator [Streptomyces sp. NBC_00140]MCX5367408.1 AfsR/SARP family transcriptional regulator [Streptomyces sp. NBC_00124]
MADDTTETAVRTDGPYASSRNPDAWRIAALEREIQELRRTNEALRVHVARELEPDPEFTVVADQELAEIDVVSGCGTTMTPAAPGRAEDARWPAQEPPRTTPAHPRALAEFHALGPIEAVVDGRLVDLGAPKQRALLALLVGKVGRPVAVDTIVEELWAGQPPPSAVSSTQAYVANLRRVLEPDRAPRTPPTVLRTYGRGYLLDTRVVEVDVHWFGERSVAGWQALDRGDPRGAVHEFETALALWRGQAYAEVADTACTRPDVARLEELRLSVVEGRCAALLAVGAHEIAVAELEAFVQDHPLREYGCELLGLALYRAGRQADALAVLRTNQRRLADELGIDPRPALRRLEQQILTQSSSLDWHPSPRPSGTATRRPPEVPDRRPGRRPPAHRDHLSRPDFFRSSLLAEL